MGLLSGMAGGLVGGAIGAAIWAAIAHFMHLEVGYVAWGVGLLVGLGFRFLGGNAQGPTAGIASAAIAIVSILAGKWCALALAIGNVGGEVQFTHEDAIGAHARQIAEAREAKGEKVAWPENVHEDAPIREHYPKDAWIEAETEWNKLPAEEQQTRIAKQQEEFNAVMGKVAGAMQFDFFLQSFGIMDLLFGFLAISTAYKLAANGPIDAKPTPAAA